MGLSIYLLGQPRIQRGGMPVNAPRGHKVWAVLAYLVLNKLPPPREHLAGLLFPEADDPMGALRWTLSVLRRQLGEAGVGGDPVRLMLPPGTSIDVEILRKGSWMEASTLQGLGHDLLEGLALRSSPGFEIWLENERRHLAGMTMAVLHQASLALLARGDAAGAVDHASELVRLSPYDENPHVLLVRCLRATGDLEAAARQVETSTALLRSELGVEPTPALRVACTSSDVPADTRVSARAAVLARVEAGEAALAAGAAEAGLERMRGAAAGARLLNDDALLAEVLAALGGALVHSARGTDEEGAAALHESATIAEQLGVNATAATAWREISWIQFLRAQYERAESSLDRTAELAAGKEEELVWVDLIRGACRHDTGDYPAAGKLLRSALERSSRLGAGQPLVQALTMLGRLHLLRGETEDALHLLDRALEEVEARNMTAFVPWPESFRAELDLLLGDVDSAEARFEHAFALGCQVGDPCWEAIAARGLGLVAATRGDISRSLEFLVEAPRLCRRLPDTYLWIEAYALDAMCAVALEHRSEAAPGWIDQLETIASRRGIRELLLRATVYRARLGETGAAEAARSMAAQIENPALGKLLESAELTAIAG